MDRSIFDTKKGQVLFELQKSFKGDSRFKMDKRFAEDIDATKLPNSLKLLTTGIDFENLSDNSDYEQKKSAKTQRKAKRQAQNDKDKKSKKKGLSHDSSSEEPLTNWLSSESEEETLSKDYVD